MNKILGSKKNIAVFVAPTTLILIVFVLLPIFYNFYLSFFRTDLMSPSQWIGFTNYINLFRDKFFLKGLRNNIILVVCSMIAHLGIGLLFANLLFKVVKGAKFFQSVFFLPSVICGVAIGMMFNFIYHFDFGLVNKALELLHLSQYTHAWLHEPQTAMYAVAFVVMWRFVGYHMVIQLAAMKSIPADLFESAAIDGATRWQQFSHITFPLIKHIFRIDAVMVITGSLKYFDLVYAMTKGGPNHASEVLATYLFTQGFRNLKYGYASAIGIIMLLLCVLSIFLVNTFIRTEKLEY